jgi:hypothetical protein
MKSFFLLVSIGIIFSSCDLFSDYPLDEKLIQFSDESKLVSESDKIHVRIIYRSRDRTTLDSTSRFVNRDYFFWCPWLDERFGKMKKGERYEWKLPDEWPDPVVPPEWGAATLDVEVLETWTVKEWLSTLTRMAQTEVCTEDSVVKWVGENWIGDQPWEGKRSGLLWRWLRKMEGPILDTNEQITTHISTRSLDGELIHSRVDISSYMQSQQQWIPAIQWVIPYLHDGDSIEIVSKSDWTFEQLDALGIPKHTPLKFNLGVHTNKKPQ